MIRTDDLFCLFHININHVEQVKMSTGSDQCWMSVVDEEINLMYSFKMQKHAYVLTYLHLSLHSDRKERCVVL